MRNMYLVGGAVRDMLMGRPSGYLDFVVEADGYDTMLRDLCMNHRFQPYLERPEFLSVRGSMHLPHATYRLQSNGEDRRPADVTLCRKEAMYHDKRHPSTVAPALLHTDLSRRDYTINAIAIAEDGRIIDPFHGRADMRNKMLDTVGDPHTRFEEDPLRILRGVRFACNLNFDPAPRVAHMWKSYEVQDWLSSVKIERVHDELRKVQDWHRLMTMIMVTYPAIGDVLYQTHRSLWFKPTLEGR